MQRQFHDRFIQAVALHLYKDDPDVDLENIMRMNGWNDLRQSVLCLTPRRFGKTTAVAMFVAAYAMCVPHSAEYFLYRSSCLSEAIGVDSRYY